MAYTPIDFSSYQAATASALESMRSEVEDKLDDLRAASKDISLYGLSSSYYVDDIGEITFDALDSATSLISNIEFEPVETRSLYDETTENQITHTFISNDLDAIEDKILGYVSAFGTEDFKQIGSAAISSTMISSLVSGANTNDSKELNNGLEILGMYVTANTAANSNWLSDLYSLKLADRHKQFYIELFNMAQANAEWASKQMVSIEELHSAFTTQYNKLTFSMVDANITAYKAEVMANIAELEIELEKVNAQLDVRGIEFDQLSAEWELKVSQAGSRLSAYAKRYKDNISASMQMLNARMAGGNSVSETYKGILTAYAQRFSAVSVGRQLG